MALAHPDTGMEHFVATVQRLMVVVRWVVTPVAGRYGSAVVVVVVTLDGVLTPGST
jgi:hypothetical protein